MEKPETPAEKQIVRGSDGQFLEGTNAGGRPKGSRSRHVAIRHEVEEAMRLQLAGSARQILATAIQMALSGNEAAMRALLDKMLTTPKDADDADLKPSEVKVIIVGPSGHETPKLTIMKPSDRPVIDLIPTKVTKPEKVKNG